MTVVGYLYWPALYFGLYLPFIMPRLPHWTSVPLVIVVTVFSGFAVVLVAAGRSLDHRRIGLHALGIVASIEVFTLVMARLQMPAFQKGAEGDDPWELLGAAAGVAVVAVMLEAGHALGRVTGAHRSGA